MGGAAQQHAQFRAWTGYINTGLAIIALLLVSVLLAPPVTGSRLGGGVAGATSAHGVFTGNVEAATWARSAVRGAEANVDTAKTKGKPVMGRRALQQQKDGGTPNGIAQTLAMEMSHGRFTPDWRMIQPQQQQHASHALGNRLFQLSAEVSRSMPRPRQPMQPDKVIKQKEEELLPAQSSSTRRLSRISAASLQLGGIPTQPAAQRQLRQETGLSFTREAPSTFDVWILAGKVHDA